MQKLLFLLILCTAFSLSAAEIREGQLWLEISLAKAASLNLHQSGSMQITDASGLFSSSFSGSVNLGLENPDVVSLYGLINRTEADVDTAEDGQNYYTRSFFAWQDSSLVIKYERIYLIRSDFVSQSEAIAFADSQGMPRSKVIPLPISGASIRITDADGNQHYFESPLRIRSNTPLSVDSSGLTYTGEFVVKVIGGKLQINHLIGLENYLAGVIQNEIGNGAPLEALKAQAVAARSHAVSLLLYNRHRDDGFDICNTTHCQVYKGEHLLNSNVLEAVLGTSSEILCFVSRVIDATYHSACGGKTDSSEQIWRGRPTPYLMGVDCVAQVEDYDLTNEREARAWIDRTNPTDGMSSWERASQSWTRTISKARLAANAGLSYISSIEITQRGHSGRILSVKLVGNSIKMLVGEYQIRQVFGSLPSSLFYIQGSYNRGSGGDVSISPSTTIRLKGKGSGHGVGMCQVGALARSRAGASYREILAHYYPGTGIRKDWLSTDE